MDPHENARTTPHGRMLIVDRLATGGMLCIPGLANAHTHSPGNLIRGSALALPLELWSLHSAAGRERRGAREV